MKSFLGNFYRHLAIFSGHTDRYVTVPMEHYSRRREDATSELVVVAHLAERSLLTPEDPGSNPNIGKYLLNLWRKFIVHY